MRKSTTLFFLCLSCLTLAAARSPFDFSTTLSDGQTLYCRIGGDNASVDSVVTLVAPSAGSGNGWEGFQAPAGELTIPARVSFDYVEYKVRYIDRKAFAGCAQLTGVVLPETMYQVGDSAFFGCSGLEQVKLAESAGSMAEIDYGKAVLAESGIRSFDFRGVRTVGEQMFFNCRQLEKVEGEVYPLREMFAGCTSLRSFVFPRQTYELQDGVLSGCTALQSIKLQDVLPPKIGKNSLDGVPADLILTVPCGTIEDYRESEWSVFSNIQEDVIPFVIKIAYDTIQGTVVVSEETLDCADQTVTITAIAKQGYAFDRWSDGIDLNRQQIELAHIFFSEHPYVDRLTLMTQDVFDMQRNSTFDLIILRDVIEHIPNQESFMHLLKYIMSDYAVVFVGFPPWQMPFGGHQQVCSSALSKLPFVHLLPETIYSWLMRKAGEQEPVIDELLGIKRTGITLERFERILQTEQYLTLRKTYWFIQPNYEVKFHLKKLRVPPIFRSLKFIRNFYTTAGYYVIARN